MKNNAIITVKTVQCGEKDEVIELTSEGSFFEKNGKFLIKYRDSILTDEYGTVETSIKVDEDDTVTVSRTGAYQSKFSLGRGKRCESFYTTPFGTMSMGFFGEEIKNNLTEKGGSLELFYTVDVNKEQINQNKIFITVREV